MGALGASPYGPGMATLHIEHPITDYATWRLAFDRLADVRRNAGVVDGRVSRPVDDPNYIVVTLDFDTTEHANGFLRFLETRVWASPDAAPALGGRPKTAILAPEDLVVV
jgi:hypothetical protein